jgi:hypothetical protein
MERLSLDVNLRNRAATQPADLPFNSFCHFNGQILAADENGIYAIDSGDDDNGTDIATQVTFATMDLGQVCRLRNLYVGLEASGSITFTVSMDEASATSYTVTPDLVGNLQHGTLVPIGSNHQGRFLKLGITSTAADWSIDRIEAEIIPLGSRRAG